MNVWAPLCENASGDVESSGAGLTPVDGFLCLVCGETFFGTPPQEERRKLARLIEFWNGGRPEELVEPMCSGCILKTITTVPMW